MILKIIICSVLFSVYIISVSQAEDSNYFTFKEETNSLYKIHNTRKSWIDAKTTCEGEDALLFYPESDNEIRMIKKWWDDSTTENKNLNALFHIGITDAEVEGKYLTVDGIRIDDVYHIWHAGEPNNIRYVTTDEDCAIMNKDLTMNDSVCNCSLEGEGNGWCYLPFICKKKLGGNKKKTGEDSNHYTFKEETNSLYKIHNTRKSWIDAKSTCQGEDALLFYPESEDEIKMIKKWWDESTTANKNLNTLFHIGITDAEVEGQFVTVDDIPIDKIYHRWHAGEPNNIRYITTDEDCVHMLKDLTINDSVCNCTPEGIGSGWCYIPFICKKKLSGNKKKSNDTKSINWTKYQYKELTHMFYKIHNTRRSWVEAKEICEAEDAKLFYPDTIEELTMIQQLWQESKNEIKLDAFIHIGLTGAKAEGEFETVDGKPISAVYHLWHKGGSGKRQSTEGGEGCVHLFNDLTINETRCNCTLNGHDSDLCYLPFICKRDNTIND